MPQAEILSSGKFSCDRQIHLPQRRRWRGGEGVATKEPQAGGEMAMNEADFLNRVEAFARDTIALRAAAWDRAGRFDEKALREAAGLGLTGMETPVGAGGLGLPFRAKAKVAETLAAADFGFAMSVINSQNLTYMLATEAPHLADRYLADLLAGARLGSTALTEPQAGSDFAAITTMAEKVSDGWVLNGTKAWIVNTAASDVIAVYAQTAQGAGGAGIGAFLVDGRREGFHRTDPISMTSQHSIGAGGFELRDYHVAADEMLRPPGHAFKAILQEINGARIYVAAMCCGMVGAALEIAAGYGRTRKTFGKRLGEHQGWRWTLGDAEVDLSAARLMVENASRLMEDGDPQFDAARTKIFTTKMAERHLPALAQLMGAEGLRDDYPFSRHLIGARIAGFVDGSTEMLLERLTGRHARE